jgi:hypothetical protein
MDEGFTVDEIAAEYNASPAGIRKTIREFRLLELAQQLKGLTKAERSQLEDPDLKTNPFTRFFETFRRRFAPAFETPSLRHQVASHRTVPGRTPPCIECAGNNSLRIEIRRNVLATLPLQFPNPMWCQESLVGIASLPTI